MNIANNKQIKTKWTEPVIRWTILTEYNFTAANNGTNVELESDSNSKHSNREVKHNGDSNLMER